MLEIILGKTTTENLQNIHGLSCLVTEKIGNKVRIHKIQFTAFRNIQTKKVPILRCFFLRNYWEKSFEFFMKNSFCRLNWIMLNRILKFAIENPKYAAKS